MGNGASPLWQWPLQSPRRLITTLAVAAAVVAVLAVLLNSPGGKGSSAAPAPAPVLSPSPSATGAPAPSATPSAPATKDYGEAIETARSFVQAWANHHPESTKAWYAGAAQYASDQFAAKLITVDYQRVPANRITGKLRLTDTGGIGQTQVAVPTDGGMMSVALVQDSDGGWLIDDIQPGAQAER